MLLTSYLSLDDEMLSIPLVYADLTTLCALDSLAYTGSPSGLEIKLKRSSEMHMVDLAQKETRPHCPGANTHLWRSYQL